MTTQQRNLGDKAPIREAMIDIRIAPDGTGSTADPAHLEQLARGLAGYPLVSPLTVSEHRIEFPHGDHATERHQGGWLCWSEDKLQAVQIRVDRFALSRLRPYQSWDSLRETAKDLWLRYVKAVSPQVVTRVTLRYINRFIVSLPCDLDEYFVAAPSPPESLGVATTQFLQRVQFFDEATRQYGRITHAHEPFLPDSAPFILDIEAWVDQEIPVTPEGVASEVWKHADRLREFKNRMFFQSITNKLLEESRD